MSSYNIVADEVSLSIAWNLKGTLIADLEGTELLSIWPRDFGRRQQPSLRLLDAQLCEMKLELVSRA